MFITEIHSILHNLPDDIHWNIIKFLSNPYFVILNSRFKRNIIYNYLDIRFDIFKYDYLFNIHVVNKLIKTFNDDYKFFKDSKYEWLKINYSFPNHRNAYKQALQIINNKVKIEHSLNYLN